MQRDGQLDHAEIRPEVAAGLREDFDQLIAHFLRELRQVLLRAELSRPPANGCPSSKPDVLLGGLRRG